MSADVLRHGGFPWPPVRLLRAGGLTMLYESGALRCVQRGEVEVIRHLYAAVRDENWLTVPGRIMDEQVKAGETSFAIGYTCLYECGEIRLEARFSLTGTEDERLTFAMQATALNAFRKNRIGFCILHPFASCAGQDCEIIHPGGERERTRFPDLIAPHQPFQQVKALHWRPSSRCEAHLTLDGDVFETEDQRNWTDASFKTYCTPLALPFPVKVQAGERFEQQIGLQVSSIAAKSGKDPTPSQAASPLRAGRGFISLSPTGAPERPLPPIGVARSTEETEWETDETETIRGLNLAHLRVEAHLNVPGWSAEFEFGAREAARLGLPLEVAAFFGDAPEREGQALVNALRAAPTPARSVLFLHQARKVTPDDLTARVLPALRDALPGAALGAGTDAYFAELNRNRPQAHALDFLCYSINPQIHAEDTRTLTDNLTAQGETVRSARAFAGRRAVYISPVTLKRRRNPDATGPSSAPPPGALPWDVDPRQMSLLGAGWTLGSIKSLAEAGAVRLTYYEASGMRGLFLPRKAAVPAAFPAAPGAIFPVYFVLREILFDSSALVIPWQSSDPRRVECLALRGAKTAAPFGVKLLLANFTPQTQTVRLASLHPPARWRVLTADGWQEGGTIESEHDGGWRLKMPPFAVAALDTAGLDRETKEAKG